MGKDVSFETWKALNIEIEKQNVVKTSVQPLANVPFGPDVGFVFKRGGILITSSTSSSGLVGHAGIAISPKYIVHIAGIGEVPTLINIDSWYSKYPATEVYGHSDSAVAEAAGLWADNIYVGSGAEYQITTDLYSTNPTYCSKIVWQAYYYGPSNPCVDIPTTKIVLPYELPELIYNVSLVEDSE